MPYLEFSSCKVIWALRRKGRHRYPSATPFLILPLCHLKLEIEQSVFVEGHLYLCSPGSTSRLLAPGPTITQATLKRARTGSASLSSTPQEWQHELKKQKAFLTDMAPSIDTAKSDITQLRQESQRHMSTTAHIRRMFY